MSNVQCGQPIFHSCNELDASVKIAFLYAFLALIATGINLGAQDFSMRAYTGVYALPLSMIVGTIAGLLVKYALDKRYIFRFRARDAAHDSSTFILYGIMGLATTCIFWGVELAFNHVYGSAAMRYVGGFIGLAIGYLAKYHLDKRFVFRNAV